MLPVDVCVWLIAPTMVFTNDPNACDTVGVVVGELKIGMGPNGGN